MLWDKFSHIVIQTLRIIIVKRKQKYVKNGSVKWQWWTMTAVSRSNTSTNLFIDVSPKPVPLNRAISPHYNKCSISVSCSQREYIRREFSVKSAWRCSQRCSYCFYYMDDNWINKGNNDFTPGEGGGLAVLSRHFLKSIEAEFVLNMYVALCRPNFSLSVLKPLVLLCGF